MKIVGCFLDGHGNYDSILVFFKKTLPNRQYFLLQLVRIMSVPQYYKMVVENAIQRKILSLVRF